MEDDATVELPPMKIVDVQEKGTRRNRIHSVKVQWSDNPRDVSWELEDVMRNQHPHLFALNEDNHEDVIP